MARRIWGFVLFLLTFVLLYNALWAPESRSYRPWSQITSKPNTDIDVVDTSAPYTAVVLYLVSLSRASELLESLASLHANVPGPAWPILLMHTGDFDEMDTRTDFVAELRTHIGAENGSWAFGNRIEFVRLDWTFPPGVSTDVDVVKPVMPHIWPGKCTSPLFALLSARSQIVEQATTKCVPSSAHPYSPSRA